MVNLKEIIRNFFSIHKIDIDSSKVVIGVSTGVDSMVLLDLMLNYTNSKVIITHVNHGKRAQSSEEEKFILEYANSKSIPCYVYHIQKEDVSNGNFQEEARKIRYNFFKDVMKKENANLLLLAHHLNDDIETIVFRLQRGSNLAGYAGIKDVVKIDEGLIARPLLTVLKKDILEYAIDNNIKYFDDESNFKDEYARNVIRHNDIPEIFNNINDAANNFIEMKNNIKNASIILNEYRDVLIKNIVSETNDYYQFSLKDFNQIHEYIQKEIIYELCKDKNLKVKQVNEVFKILESDKANIVSKVGALQIVKSYGEVYLFKKELEDKNNIAFYINDLEKKEYNVDNLVVSISDIDTNKCKQTIHDNFIMAYNYNLLPLEVRTWNDGDRIITRAGTKMVSRILIDNHVNYLKRKRVLVVCKDSDILMVVGYAKSLIALEKYTSIDQCNMIISFKEKEKQNA